MPEETAETTDSGPSSDTATESDGAALPADAAEQRLYLDGEHYLAAGICVIAIGAMAVSMIYVSRRKKKGANTGT